MGNQSSNSRDGYSSYGPPLPGHPYPHPYYDPRIHGDPYAYVNPLPIPPKEPLPQGPYYGHHTPHLGPETIREREPEDKYGSVGRKRGQSLMRSLTGLGKKLGSGKADQYSTVWTYPNGTPFPKKRLELSPHTRPQRLRSSSFSGRDKKTEREYFLGQYQQDGYLSDSGRPTLGSLARLRSLGQNPKDRDRDRTPERYKITARENRQVERERDGYFFDYPAWEGTSRPRHRRVHSETRDPRPRGVPFDTYVPPDKRVREWTFPDGTPYPRPNEVSPIDPAQNGPVYPSGVQAHPPGMTPNTVAGGLPRAPTPNPHIFPAQHSASSSLPHPPVPVHLTPNAQPHLQPAPQTQPTSVSQLPSALPEFLNPERAFSFDRTNELCHFSYHGVVYGGKLYPSAYHLWEAMKFLETRPELAKRIRKCERVREAMKIAQELGVVDARPDWNQVALKMLDEALHVKCRQHFSVLQALIATEHKHIIFLSQREPFWGWSTHGRKGENHLGHSLERVRDRLWAEGEPRPPMPAWRAQELDPYAVAQT